jgi:hypothetical protein
MDLLFIIMLIIVGVIFLEISKHLFTKTILKVLLFSVILIIVFFAVIGSLASEKLIESDNKYIQTGATVVKLINEEPIVTESKEKIKTFFKELEEKVTNKLTED